MVLFLCQYELILCVIKSEHFTCYRHLLIHALMRYLLGAEESDRSFRGYDDAPVLRYDNPLILFVQWNNSTPNRFLLRPDAYCTTRPHPICAVHRSLSLSPTVISSLAHPPPHASDTTDYTGWLPSQKGCVSSFHFTEWNLRDVALPPTPSNHLPWTRHPIRLKFRQLAYFSVALNFEAFYITTLLSDIYRHCVSYSCLFKYVRKL